jgi:signal transduction histidine kinase/DNA-binding response OmpR family regulator
MVWPESPGAERVNILVVDDRPAKLLAMEALLADLHENVVCVSSGHDALRQLLERPFAVVLLDVNMPEMDGFETAALIRQRPRCEHVPIIFMTADTDETHALHGYSLGAVDYILTPAIPEVLRTKVKVFVDLFRMAETLKRQADQRVALAEERAARATAEEANRRTSFLAEAGKVMARSLDLGSTVDAILRLLVPRVGDYAVVRVGLPPGHALERGYDAGAGSPFPAAKSRHERLQKALDRAEETAHTQVFSADTTLEGEEWHGLLACPLLARDKVVGVLGIISAGRSPFSVDDLRVLLEDLSGRAAIAVDNSLLYREIEQRETRKDQFVAMLAHELRNPLSAITGALGVLQIVGGRDQRTVRARDVIGRQLQHLTQLVDDLLDVARVTTGRISLTRSVVSLSESVERCLKIFAGSGKTEDYILKVEAQNVWVEADITRLDQILMNLIANALKYTPKKGIIEIRVAGNGHTATADIQDSGIGMPPEVLGHVFELFFQADRTVDRTQGGLGIGLTLVRQLVELHGGTVEAFSRGENQGSRFTVRLPQIAGPSAVQPPPATASRSADERYRILLVEDNDDSREMLRTLLSLRGHEVYEATDGPSGIKLAYTVHPDLAFIDIGLPGCDGYEVARTLRASTEARDVPLIALTGYGQPHDRRRALEAGFDTHIVKPIDPMALTAVVASHGRRSPNERNIVSDSR